MPLTMIFHALTSAERADRRRASRAARISRAERNRLRAELAPYFGPAEREDLEAIVDRHTSEEAT